MIEIPQLAKKNILDALTSFNKIYLTRPNSYLVQTFFDAKSDEIVDILSGGPTIKISKTLKILNKVSPFFGSKWKNVEKIVIETLINSGLNVICLGLSTTPTVEIAVTEENAYGGIIITASHNPNNLNALKLLNHKG